MIYLDNAATTMQKPPAVAEAITSALSSFGGVGRGVHPASIAAGLAVYEARAAVAELFGVPGEADRVAFAQNATMALNIAIDSLLPQGGTALTTAASHNSVLRPLFKARDEQGCTIKIAPISQTGALDYAVFEQMLEGVDLVAITHASNLTGDVYDVARLTQLAHKAGARVVVDAAQTAGAFPLNAQQIGADVICFTGHKALLGPQGTGGLYVAPGVEIKPLLEGGSGTHSFDERHPLFMPESLEAGTLNAHGLAGLAAGIAYIQECGVVSIADHEAELARQFKCALQDVKNVHLLGGGADGGQSGIVALNIADLDSALVADALANEWGICTRAGAHCAPLMHMALGTEKQGAVRFSFGAFNTAEEVAIAADAVKTIAQRINSGEM